MSMSSPPVPALSALPVARGGVWGVLLPSLPGPGRPPFPGQRCGTAPGARESQIAKTPVASTPIWEAGCPPASAFSGPWAVPGAQAPAEGPWPTEPVAKPYLSHLGLPASSRLPGLSVFLASIRAVLWAHWPAALPPGLVPPSPARPFLDPARTTVGPSLHSWSRPLCRPHTPSLVRPLA